MENLHPMKLNVKMLPLLIPIIKKEIMERKKMKMENLHPMNLKVKMLLLLFPIIKKEIMERKKMKIENLHPMKLKVKMLLQLIPVIKKEIMERKKIIIKNRKKMKALVIPKKIPRKILMMIKHQQIIQKKLTHLQILIQHIKKNPNLNQLIVSNKYNSFTY